MKLDRAFLDAFHRLGAKPGETYGMPVAKKLSLLVRPAFVARPGRTLVWGDFSNIEARVLPWLAASEGAEAKLDIFRAIDVDDSLPDVYIRTAADLLGENAEELWADFKRNDDSAAYKHAYSARQSHGKVPELSLGFGGGLGALQAMATNYGVYLDTKTAERVVRSWRDANQWARDFWGKHNRHESSGLWGAANQAIENPDTPYEAGRVVFVYDRAYLGGTLFCALPCGRLLTYPNIKWGHRVVKDKKTKEDKDVYDLSFIKGYGRSGLWYGKIAENVTQAGAASVLRRTLKRLDKDWVRTKEGGHTRYVELMPTVMHTHDEVVTEPFICYAEEAKAALQEVMERNDEWDEGLPLKAEISECWTYTKSSHTIKTEGLK